MPNPKVHKGRNQSKTGTAKSATVAVNAGVDKATSKTRGATKKRKTKKSFNQAKATVGILVTEDLETAIARCKSKVQRIAKNCRAHNRKFRDTDFDLENDQQLCLRGLDPPDDEELDPADVMRVTDIFENPQLFMDGASSSDVAQGMLGDCWFLSAIANVASIPGLIEKICVARDEAVGVYGFIFFRDDSWVDVVIDDQLFVQVPKFESLTPDEQKLYHDDPDLYHSIARKGSKILYFARSKTDGETWVPLIEKAYAKLHGSYYSMSGGLAMEGIEDLTGGVCHQLPLVDVLDPNKLWEELSQNENQSVLYGCGLDGVDNDRSMDTAKRVHGLITGHAYSILRAQEYNGKRFVVIRNPWGTGEWKGRWSDGSKEWTAEWMPALTTLGHSFGNDGQFVMEYSDFLRLWSNIDCARLFDSSWAFSSMWVESETFSPLHPWTWGDISFTISVPEATPAVIVLQQVDDRYFKDIAGYLQYDFEFAVFKKDEKEQYATSNYTGRFFRSQNCEVHLEAGEYVVHVRVETLKFRDADYMESALAQDTWSYRNLKRVRARQAEAYSKASNFSIDTWGDVMPTSLETVAGYDLTRLEIKVVEDKREANFKKKAVLTPQVATEESTDEKKEGEEDEEDEDEDEDEDEAEDDTGTKKADETTTDPAGLAVHTGIFCDSCKVGPITGIRYKCANSEHPDYDLCQECMDKKEHDPTHEFTLIPTSRVKQIVHNVMCNMCETHPVVGIRYKCMEDECPDFDMCSECHAKGEHNPTHSLLMMPVPAPDEGEEEGGENDGANAEPVTFDGVGCDGCGKNPIVAPRFKCMDAACPNYDLCEDCVGKGIHPSNHQLLRLDSPEEANHLHPGVQGASLLLGLRVYTLKTAKTTLGAQLRHGSLNRGT